MPLYEYECETCGHRFEIIQKFSDRPVETCPKCGGAVRKLLSSPAIQFKGSGWYITDYARKNSGEASKGDGSSKSGDAKPAEAAKSSATESSADKPSTATSAPSKES